jgi:hypothetical protein
MVASLPYFSQDWNLPKGLCYLVMLNTCGHRADHNSVDETDRKIDKRGRREGRGRKRGRR